MRGLVKLSGALVLSAMASSAVASIIEFTFDGTYFVGSTPKTLTDRAGSLSWDDSAAVKDYMNWVLSGTGLSVLSVTGAKVERDYTGDQHVVGPVINGSRKSLTLGNSNGVTFADTVSSLGSDNFLVNHSKNGNNKITMVFSGPIQAVSFDYEIFPNSDCENPPGSCREWPDFVFKTNGNLRFSDFGLDPQSNQTMGGGAANMAYRHSPISGSGYEKSPQVINVSGWWPVVGATPDGSTTLEFIDWPSTIGIDRLRVRIPEPGTLSLVGLAFAGLWWRRRRNASG